MSNTLSWLQVHAVHKTVAGIFSVNGKAVSLLVNTNSKGPYPNQVSKNEIIYFFGASTQTWGINALIKSVGEKSSLHVFQKNGINQWSDLGQWVPVEIMNQKDDFWPVRLVPKK